MNLTAGLKVLSLPFDHETTDVLIGSYLSREAALQDYRAALAGGAYTHGAVVISRDLDGTVAVEQSDHMVREVAQALGTVGFLTGMFIPLLVPLTTATGAVVGGVLGEVLHMLTETKAKGQAASMLPLGCAVLLLAYPRSSAPTVEPLVRRAATKVTGEAQGHHLQALRGALAGAQQQMIQTQN